MPRPQNIFDVINQNIVTVSEDVHTLMGAVSTLQKELVELKSIFNAPASEKPNAHGEEDEEE